MQLLMITDYHNSTLTTEIVYATNCDNIRFQLTFKYIHQNTVPLVQLQSGGNKMMSL